MDQAVERVDDLGWREVELQQATELQPDPTLEPDPIEIEAMAKAIQEGFAQSAIEPRVEHSAHSFDAVSLVAADRAVADPDTVRL